MSGYTWVEFTGVRLVLPGMVVAGRDRDGSTLVVGRAFHENDVLPAKAKPEKGTAYVAYGGKEYEKAQFQILMSSAGHFEWRQAGHGIVPGGAVVGGKTSDGETLFIGRCTHECATCIGKIHPTNRCLYFSYGGKEYKRQEYDVLVCKCN